MPKLRKQLVMAPMAGRFSPGGVTNVAAYCHYWRPAEGSVATILSEGAFVNFGNAHIDEVSPTG